VRGGHARVVTLLPERGCINPNTTDTQYGRTPPLLVTVEGLERAVQLLPERGGANPKISDLSGDTPLELAASGQHTRVVELLSKPEPTLSIPIDTSKVLEHPTSPKAPPNLSHSPVLQSLPPFLLVLDPFLAYRFVPP